MNVTVTPVGAATLLFDIEGLSILVDPALDPQGSTFELPVPAVNSTLSMTRTVGPALAAEQLEGVDVVLLTHDLHPDHLDTTGRRIVATAGTVVTTTAGAARLGSNAVGLEPGETHKISKDGVTVALTATAGRHGPEGIERVVGDVIGFLIQPVGTEAHIYVSGDTVDYPGLDSVTAAGSIGTAFLHVGAARFPQTGDMTFTMSSAEACALAARLDAATVVPVHYDSWSHFSEPADVSRATFAQSAVADRVRWLTPGAPQPLAWPSLTV